MRNWMPSAVTGAVVAFSAAAYGDVTFVNSSPATGLPAGNVVVTSPAPPPAATSLQIGNGNRFGAIDGLVGEIRIFYNGAFFGLPPTVLTGTFETVSSVPTGFGGDFGVVLWTGTFVNAPGGQGPMTWTVTQVEFSYAGGNTASYVVPGGVTMSPSTANSVVSSGTFQSNATTTPGFDYSQVTNLRLYWSYNSTNPVSGNRTFRMRIDAIGNPEPGTLALFGLGALGLGGVAWRRRNQRAARTAAAKS